MMDCVPSLYNQMGLPSQRLCGFLGKLPPELRIEVYRELLVFDQYVFVRDTSYNLTWETEPDCAEGPEVYRRLYLDPNRCEFEKLPLWTLGILRTNKTIRREASHVFYSQNTFFFYHIAAIVIWLQSLSKEDALSLRTLSIMSSDELEHETAGLNVVESKLANLQKIQLYFDCIIYGNQTALRPAPEDNFIDKHLNLVGFEWQDSEIWEGNYYIHVYARSPGKNS
jgi:hypothetical protein